MADPLHRHKDSRQQWTSQAPTGDLSVYALKTDLAALADRVAALESPVVTPPPVTPPTLNSKPAKSIADVKALLLDDTVDEIVLAAGTYSVSPAQDQSAASLWMGRAYAGRTRPVVVSGYGVTLDLGGATYALGLAFEEGVHDLAWEGVTLANGQPTDTGIIVFGGYAGMAAPHHIGLTNVTVSGCSSHTSQSNDHAMYFSMAVGGPHDITVDGFTVVAKTGSPYALSSAVHAYHSDAANQNAWNVSISRLAVQGTYQAIVLWDATLHDWVIADSTIAGALSKAVRYEGPAKGPVLLRNVVSTNSGGFYSSLGSTPPGITLQNCSLA